MRMSFYLFVIISKSYEKTKNQQQIFVTNKSSGTATIFCCVVFEPSFYCWLTCSFITINTTSLLLFSSQLIKLKKAVERHVEGLFQNTRKENFHHIPPHTLHVVLIVLHVSIFYIICYITFCFGFVVMFPICLFFLL